MSGEVKGSSWNSQSIGDCFNSIKFSQDQTIRLVISVVLAVLAGVATYYCITKGLALQDRAVTGLERFGAGFLLYMGAVGGFVTMANFIYGTCFNCVGSKDYTPSDAGLQCLGTVCAPAAAVPLALCAGLQAAAKG